MAANLREIKLWIRPLETTQLCFPRDHGNLQILKKRKLWRLIDYIWVSLKHIVTITIETYFSALLAYVHFDPFCKKMPIALFVL